ncbi:MAG: TetR/AcrR family transcriptional regulator C-terminal domain-containing protein [Actinomycetota bacterium]|nr:TetR/AcrR family transcriptional regulator C-terminal domain-containing protein [Actinomycetota bacterium]
MKPDQKARPAEQSKAGRVGRPRRLSTHQIVMAAIELADGQGLGELSMPKLAKSLGVGTMTLYGYIDNKEDLLDRIADQIFQGLDVPDHDDWREGLFRFLSDFRAAAVAHPALARLLATGRITIPAVFDILETFFQKMTDDGAPVEDAVRTFYAALTYTIGFVLWEIPRARTQPETAYADQWAGLISQLDPHSFPILTGIAGGVVPTVASTDQFSWGLNRILNG